MTIDYGKVSAFYSYIRVRKVLAHNESFKRPGQAIFIRYGRERVAALEKEFPDFRAEFTKCGYDKP
jgi:hypothetical protein